MCAIYSLHNIALLVKKIHIKILCEMKIFYQRNFRKLHYHTYGIHNYKYYRGAFLNTVYIAGHFRERNI